MRYEIHDNTGDLRCVQHQPLDANCLAALKANYPEAADALQAVYDNESPSAAGTYTAASGWTIRVQPRG